MPSLVQVYCIAAGPCLLPPRVAPRVARCATSSRRCGVARCGATKYSSKLIQVRIRTVDGTSTLTVPYDDPTIMLGLTSRAITPAVRLAAAHVSKRSFRATTPRSVLPPMLLIGVRYSSLDDCAIHKTYYPTLASDSEQR